MLLFTINTDVTTEKDELNDQVVHQEILCVCVCVRSAKTTPSSLSG